MNEVIKIQAGEYHTLVLDKNGTVHSFGGNRHVRKNKGGMVDKSYNKIQHIIDPIYFDNNPVISIVAVLDKSFILT